MYIDFSERFAVIHEQYRAEISETLGLGLDHFSGLSLGLENTHFPGLGLVLSLEYL